MQTNCQLKANRLLYIIIISVLCLTALIVGIVASVNREDSAPVIEAPVISDADGEETDVSTPVINDTNEENEESLPVFLAPAGGTVSKDHSPDTYVYSKTMGDYRTHTGIDIATSIGSGVYAAADGVIEKIWTDDFMGKCISISHSGDAITVYKNLANELPDGIAEGKEVSAGEKIAYVGDSAALEYAEEPHLHFELVVKNIYEDPLDNISAESKSASLVIDEGYEG